MKGLTRSYTDNGDGTITDNRTGLDWEKLSNDGSIHDWRDTYTWYTAFTTKIATLNSGNFAGHNDWRLPNVHELHGIVNYGTYSPDVDAALGSNGATTWCESHACSSCCATNFYWTSTTAQRFLNTAWAVDFYDGEVQMQLKTSPTYFFYVRAVRGGS